jgi:hypothetical protein
VRATLVSLSACAPAASHFTTPFTSRSISPPPPLHLSFAISIIFRPIRRRSIALHYFDPVRIGFSHSLAPHLLIIVTFPLEPFKTCHHFSVRLPAIHLSLSSLKHSFLLASSQSRQAKVRNISQTALLIPLRSCNTFPGRILHHG